MSTTAITNPPASLTLYGTDKAPTVATVCRNPECSLELTAHEKSRRAALNGMCEDCNERGVTLPALPPAKSTAPAAPQTSHTAPVEAFQQCTECPATYATPADLIAAYNIAQGEDHPAVTTADAVTFCPECYENFVYPPSTATEPQNDPDAASGIRRCGNCDTSISGLHADTRFCSVVCEQDAVPADVPATRPAPGVVEVRFVSPKKFDRNAPEKETDTGRNSPMSVAVDVVMFARPDLTEHQAETGLRAAVAHWAHGKVKAAGVTAAARAWTPAGEDYDEMKHWAQGRANTAALKLLKKAIRSAHEYNAAISS